MKSVRVQSYSVRIWESTDQNNSEYEHFLRSASNNGPLNVENLTLPVFSSEWPNTTTWMKAVPRISQ